MFNRSRKKIVAAIMSVLVLLWIGTLAVIYVSSYIEVSSRNDKMLEEYAAVYVPEKQGDEFVPGRPVENRGPHFNTKQFKLSTFYSVEISYNGEVLKVRNDESAVYTDEELARIAYKVADKEKQTGVINKLVYYKADKGGFILIAFMDNTIIRESMSTLFRYTLIFGGVVIVALYFLAAYLAKRIVKPLEESYQKQKQFISDAGHELKTPISVVNANADILSREIGENQWLSNIQYENERMGKLVGQLLELARTENVSIVKESLDLSRLTAGGILPFESVAYEKGFTLNVEIPDGIRVIGNATQLSQLVSILVDNAIRHSSDGGEILVKLSESRNHAVLTVVNVGEPIPPEKLGRLFERFYRADEARNSDNDHYGLGLAIAKAVVTVHSGKIEARCHNGLVEFRATIAKN